MLHRSVHVTVIIKARFSSKNSLDGILSLMQNSSFLTTSGNRSSGTNLFIRITRVTKGGHPKLGEEFQGFRISNHAQFLRRCLYLGRLGVTGPRA